MADWRQLAKSLALADGKIDTREAAIIRKEIFGDGKLDKSELEFLIEVKKSAQSVAPEYNEMLFKALKAVILADGSISAKEAAWLRKFIFADGKVDVEERRFLQDLKNSAKSTSPEFDQLYAQCVSG